jgi:hypothetical protein
LLPLTAAAMRHAPTFYETCAKCGQATLTGAVWGVRGVEARALEPQGEAMRLFAPAPNQIPGQLSL